MSLRINNNIAAINAHRNLLNTTDALTKSMEKLSSGYRINRAADNPAGLVISEQFRAQIAGLNQAIKNSEGSINMIQTAEGALTEINTLLVSMRELAIHAANEGFNDIAQLEADQAEINNAITTIDRIAANTQFGTKKLLNGTNANTAVFTGAHAGSSGANIRESSLSDGTHYLTSTKISDSSASLNTSIYGIAIDSTVTPANLSDGDHTLDVITSSTAAIKNNGTAVTIVDDWGNGITFGAAVDAPAVVSTATLNGAATAADAGTVTFALSYQTGGGDVQTATITQAVTDGMTQAQLLTALNSSIDTAFGTGVITATILAGGTLSFVTDNSGSDYSIAVGASAYTGSAAAWFALAAQDDRGVASQDLALEVVVNGNYDTAAQQQATLVLTGTHTTIASLLTEINDKLNDALGTGFGMADGTTQNITASEGTDGSIVFTTADEGSAYSIRGMANNAGIGYVQDSIAWTGNDAVVRFDGYTTQLNRVDWGADRNWTIGNKAVGETGRGTMGITVTGLSTTGGGVDIGNMIVDVEAARFAVYLDGSSAHTVIAGIETNVTDTSGLEQLKIVLDLDAEGGSETITNNDNSLVFQIGANVGQTAKISLPNMSSTTLGRYLSDNMYASLADIDVTSAQGAQDSQAVIDQAIDEVTVIRGTLGSFQKNTLESNLRNLRIASQNLQASESNIRDTDMAEEMSTFVKDQILMQAGTAMLAQGNQIPQVVLSLFS